MMISQSSSGFPKFVVEMTAIPFLIGHFVMEWTKQEQNLAWLIADIEGGNRADIVDSILAGPAKNYEQKLLAARAKILCIHPVQDWIDRVLELHKYLRSIRHDIIHGSWASMNADEEYLLNRKEKGKTETIRPFSSDELRRHAQRVNELNCLIIDTRRVLKGDKPIASVPKNLPAQSIP